jgi:valyl-tRNA synthetase
MTEHLYRSFFSAHCQEISVHLTTWPRADEFGAPALDATILDFGEIMRDEIAKIRRYKSENQLSMRAEIPACTIVVAPEHYKLFWASRLDFLACTHAESVMFEQRSTL